MREEIHSETDPQQHRLPAFRAALVATIPVLLGYLAIGLAFGLLLTSSGYPWFLAPIMSITIYAGAAQFMAVGLFTAGASLAAVATVTLLLNARHMVYGLSLLGKFADAGKARPYLVFALTDETYALLTSVEPPPDIHRTRFYVMVSALDQFYWVFGSTLGALLGTWIKFDPSRLGFALTALFVVLLIEQIRTVRVWLPYAIALVCGVAAMLLLPGHMLIAALTASILLLACFRRALP